MNRILEVQKVVINYYGATGKPATKIFISCNVLAELLVEVNRVFVFRYYLPEYSKDYLLHLSDFNAQFIGCDLIRIVDDNFIVASS